MGFAGDVGLIHTSQELARGLRRGTRRDTEILRTIPFLTGWTACAYLRSRRKGCRRHADIRGTIELLTSTTESAMINLAVAVRTVAGFTNITGSIIVTGDRATRLVRRFADIFHSAVILAFATARRHTAILGGIPGRPDWTASADLNHCRSDRRDSTAHVSDCQLCITIVRDRSTLGAPRSEIGDDLPCLRWNS